MYISISHSLDILKKYTAKFLSQLRINSLQLTENSFYFSSISSKHTFSRVFKLNLKSYIKALADNVLSGAGNDILSLSYFQKHWHARCFALPRILWFPSIVYCYSLLADNLNRNDSASPYVALLIERPCSSLSCLLCNVVIFACVILSIYHEEKSIKVLLSEMYESISQFIFS